MPTLVPISITRALANTATAAAAAAMLVRDARLATIVRARDRLAAIHPSRERVRRLVGNLNARIDQYLGVRDWLCTRPHLLDVPRAVHDEVAPDDDDDDDPATPSQPEKRVCRRPEPAPVTVADTTNRLREPFIGRAHAILYDADAAVVVYLERPHANGSAAGAPSSRVRTPDADELVEARAALVRACLRVRSTTPAAEAEAADAECPVCLQSMHDADRIVIEPACGVCEGAREPQHRSTCAMSSVGACVECMVGWMSAQWNGGRKLAAVGVACPLCRGRFCEDDCVRLLPVA